MYGHNNLIVGLFQVVAVMVIGERVEFFSRVGPAEIIFCFGKVKGGGANRSATPSCDRQLTKLSSRLKTSRDVVPERFPIPHLWVREFSQVCHTIT